MVLGAMDGSPSLSGSGRHLGLGEFPLSPRGLLIWPQFIYVWHRFFDTNVP